jgi:hypothetical protein
MSDKNLNLVSEIFWTVAIIWFFAYELPSIWHSKFRYFVQYAPSSYGDIHIDKRPIDCDWFAAPLGNKGCDYEAKVEVQTYIVRDNGYGKMFWSDDGGKTWHDNEGNAVKPSTQVYLSWSKTDE